MPDEQPPAKTPDTAAVPADPGKPDPPKLDPPPSGLGKFIVRYPTFISSLVVGIAGLIATTIWQYRNYHSQLENAAAQQKIAETQAANSWKIERAEILGKQLSTLAQSGADTADQRYGVLLSLTRAEIIDPELAVSYALELGKVNPEYMVSVLTNTPKKEYPRLARAFALSCMQRYGVSPPIDACADKLGARSRALAQLMFDETQLALATDPLQPGPLVLFKDERRVQRELRRLAELFEGTLVDLYTRREWDEIDKLEQYAVGAHVVGAVVLSAVHTGEFVTEDEARTLEAFHTKETKWLADYIAGRSCDADCKGRMIEVMLTRYADAQGGYDAAMKKLLAAPRAQSAVAIARLHARLLWCQVDPSEVAPLRDNVLVPVAADLLKASSDAYTRDAVMSLLAVIPEPAAGDGQAAAAWQSLVATLDKTEAVARMFRERRATAARQRAAPPPAMRKSDFCIAAPVAAPATESADAAPAGSAAPP